MKKGQRHIFIYQCKDVRPFSILHSQLHPRWGFTMKVMLLFPPNWNPAMPHLALPTITAFLRAHGVEVIQRDLNIEVFDEVLTRRHLEGALARLRRDYGPQGDRRPPRPMAAPRD